MPKLEYSRLFLLLLLSPYATSIKRPIDRREGEGSKFFFFFPSPFSTVQALFKRPGRQKDAVAHRMPVIVLNYCKCPIVRLGMCPTHCKYNIQPLLYNIQKTTHHMGNKFPTKWWNNVTKSITWKERKERKRKERPSYWALYSQWVGHI